MGSSILHSHRSDPWYSRKKNTKQHTVYIGITLGGISFPNSVVMIQIISSSIRRSFQGHLVQPLIP